MLKKLPKGDATLQVNLHTRRLATPIRNTLRANLQTRYSIQTQIKGEKDYLFICLLLRCTHTHTQTPGSLPISILTSTLVVTDRVIGPTNNLLTPPPRCIAGWTTLQAGHRQPWPDSFWAVPGEAVCPILRRAGQTAPEAGPNHAAFRHQLPDLRSAVARIAPEAAASGAHRRAPQPWLLSQFRGTQERQRKFPGVERRRGGHSKRPQPGDRTGCLRRGVSSVRRAARPRPDRLLFSGRHDVATLRLPGGTASGYPHAKLRPPRSGTSQWRTPAAAQTLHTVYHQGNQMWIYWRDV